MRHALLYQKVLLPSKISFCFLLVDSHSGRRPGLVVTVFPFIHSLWDSSWPSPVLGTQRFNYTWHVPCLWGIHSQVGGTVVGHVHKSSQLHVSAVGKYEALWNWAEGVISCWECKYIVMRTFGKKAAFRTGLKGWIVMRQTKRQRIWQAEGRA